MKLALQHQILQPTFWYVMQLARAIHWLPTIYRMPSTDFESLYTLLKKAKQRMWSIIRPKLRKLLKKILFLCPLINFKDMLRYGEQIWDLKNKNNRNSSFFIKIFPLKLQFWDHTHVFRRIGKFLPFLICFVKWFIFT